MSARWPAAILVLAVALFGITCNPPKITFVSPGPLEIGCAIELEFELTPGRFDETTVEAYLNLLPLAVTGGPTTFTATIPASFPPIVGENFILVKVKRLSDGVVQKSGKVFEWAPEPSEAFQITNPADLLTGPLAHNQLDDWMLRNGEATFVVDDVLERDLYSVGQYGGNLIDAAVAGTDGPDHFIEISPMVNIETVLNHSEITLVNDGANCEPAIIEACGPDDLLDFANPSSQIFDALGFLPPGYPDDLDQEVWGCTTYTLEPNKPYVRVDTALTNLSGALNRYYIGDWANAGGELEQWSAPDKGVGPALVTPTGSPNNSIAWYGYGEAAGVDYGYTTTPIFLIPANTSLVSISGVTVILHSQAVLNALLGAASPFAIFSGGTRAFTRYFGVGDGSGSNTIDMVADIKNVASGNLTGCVTVNGSPEAGARVAVGTGLTTATSAVVAHFVTRPGACPNYGGTVPVGSYEAAAAKVHHGYETGASSPPLTPITIVSGANGPLDFDLPEPASLVVNVTDGLGDPIPARVTVVGFDPSPPLVKQGESMPGFGGADLGVFNDPSDSPPFGATLVAYADSTGTASFDIEVPPGAGPHYQVNVTRGAEYSRFSTLVTVSAGAQAPIAAQIARVVDTPGFVSSDFHVHGIHSADSRVTHRRRVEQFAGENIENPVMTDHHVHTDITPTIAAMGLADELTSMIGEEITTFDYGHFNGYPFTIDASVPSGGSTDWAKAAPVGDDFPSKGALNGTPAEIFALATTGNPTSIPGTTTIQINHIDSHFQPLKIDTSVAGTIGDGMTDGDRAGRRLPDTTAVPNLFHHFPALELWNGSTRGGQSEFLDKRIGIWMNHLNKGLPTTFIADTDTHTYTNLRTAGARTWTASPTGDAPSAILSADVADAVNTGRAVGGQGIYVQARLLAQDGSGLVADLEYGGSTTVATTNGSADLEITIQAPAWAQYDRIEVYANAATTPVAGSGNTLFGATSTVELNEGDCDYSTTSPGDGGDFDVTEYFDLFGVTGADKLETTHTVSFTGLAVDTWFVVVVKGTDGCSEPMFPVYASNLDSATNSDLSDLIDGNLGEDGVMGLAATNALYLDADGVPGFQPPNP